jgi:hypothetical protein
MISKTMAYGGLALMGLSALPCMSAVPLLGLAGSFVSSAGFVLSIFKV